MDKNIKDFQKEAKKREMKQKFQTMVNDGLSWVNRNKENIAIVTAVGIPVAKGGVKLISKAMVNHKLNKEIDFKERHIYDRSLGRYTELKHKLSKKEALEIERRKNGGEKLNIILDSMGLLK